MSVSCLSALHVKISMFCSPGGEEGHGVRDSPWPWHRSEAWGRRDLDGPQSAGGRCLGDVIVMLDYMMMM